MKRYHLFFFLLLTMFISLQCSEDDISETEIDATIIGRWQAEGFEELIRYEFTSDKRYTIYTDTTGVFPILEQFMTDNPGIQGLDWYYSGDTVVVDLNFGNFSKLIPIFKCDNYVIDWNDGSSSFNSRYFREGYALEDCE